LKRGVNTPFLVSFRREHVRAAVTAVLISDQAAFITGQHFTVDGGVMKKMIYLV
jgi:hypothetical protein